MPRRVKLTRQSDGVALSETSESDGIKTQTIYRTATGGSCQLTSNPHRTIGDATMGWMRTRFDLNRRPVETAHFGATAPGACTDLTGRNGLTTTEYDAITAGPLTKVVEEAEDPDKQRDSITDALGRLKQVTEYEGTTTYPTTYTYDTIDNLTQVSQSGQTRTYAYDSLSRLACASNPESRNTTTPCSLTAPATGVDRFTYDDAGQIESKTDARGARTDYVYDALNRLTDKTFTTAANVAATADVLYCYDGRDYNAGSHACTGSQSAPNVGLLTAVGSSESATRMLYDSLGRVASSQQRTADETYGFTYSYLLNDAIQSVSYPSGRLVTQTYDDAGRMVSGSDGATAYVTEAQYEAHGALRSLRYGNGLYEQHSYNRRLQATDIRLGSTLGAQDYLGLAYGFSATSNNGNVQQQTIAESGLTHAQHYSYDGVNRLTMASEGALPAANCPGGAAWCRRFGYDAFGNRALLESPGIASMPGITSFDSSTNRLTTAGYDPSGNMTQDPTGRQMSYDVENRLAAFTDPGMTAKNRSYGYDGDGRRVRKTNGSASTIYVYDAFGRLAAEYEPTAPSGAGGRFYRTADTLGSTRLITDATTPNPAVLARYDFTPFGERIPSGAAGRASTMATAGSGSTSRGSSAMTSRSWTTSIRGIWLQRSGGF